MKRIALIAYVEKNKCLLRREGRRHSLYVNPESDKTSTIPRHREIDNFLASKICKDLGIPKIK